MVQSEADRPPLDGDAFAFCWAEKALLFHRAFRIRRRTFEAPVRRTVRLSSVTPRPLCSLQHTLCRMSRFRANAQSMLCRFCRLAAFPRSPRPRTPDVGQFAKYRLAVHKLRPDI